MDMMKSLQIVRLLLYNSFVAITVLLFRIVARPEFNDWFWRLRIIVEWCWVLLDLAAWAWGSDFLLCIGQVYYNFLPIISSLANDNLDMFVCRCAYENYWKEFCSPVTTIFYHIPFLGCNERVQYVWLPTTGCSDLANYKNHASGFLLEFCSHFWPGLFYYYNFWILMDSKWVMFQLHQDFVSAALY